MRVREQQHELWMCLKQIKIQPDRNRWTDAKPEETKDRREKIKETHQLLE